MRPHQDQRKSIFLALAAATAEVIQPRPLRNALTCRVCVGFMPDPQVNGGSCRPREWLIELGRVERRFRVAMRGRVTLATN